MPSPSSNDDFIALLAGRSANWVREQALGGRVEALRGPRIMVSRRDVLRLKRQMRPKPQLPVPYLRLVVDNT